ncbi:hypothetical protein BU25DRAFT_230894 [Macroventuria anomochaeta]|uniref:Uncharacterized protein n=1 Tax=Macroventuria anomochaeta TaxID=301207 RepID=A0ACB6RK61_9PLEO|nr:uncharacterized protein BU25DRAFT_230894 [Macroventuria anomochaeta]KAF2621790.1 hypothetical protein BU25DRAFT_230894 [Macroventuria anomochaeta]
MSATIALQDVDTSLNKETSTVRQRNICKIDSSQEDDPWLNEPHDNDTSNIPLDSTSFAPTSVYWITPHGMLTKSITILDLTADMHVPYTGLTDTYKAAIKTTLKDHSFTPVITCHRQNWIGLKYDIRDDQNKIIAHWSHPWLSAGEAILTFPDESTHSSHPISLVNKTWGLRTESFTFNSQLFIWKMDSVWHSYNMTLYKVLGSGEHEKKVEVGKYSQKWWGSCATGGAFVLDGREIDGVVACLTLVIVLKKKRQRTAERYGNGAY